LLVDKSEGMSGDYSMGGVKLFRYNEPMAFRYKSDILALALLALLALIFFWPVTLNLGWIPQGGGDLVSFLWPTYSYAAQSLHAGRIPLWNPTLYSGAPFAADNQSGLFYPINLLTFLFFPSLPYTAMEWLVVFHFWLAGASMYFLMRVLLSEESSTRSAPKNTDDTENEKRSVKSDLIRAIRVQIFFPALFSAIAYMFSDVFIMHIGHLNIVATSAWLPAAFAALHLGFTRHSAGWAAGAGVILGIAVLAGHAQMTLIITFGLGLYALWNILIGQRRLSLIGLVGLMFVVAFGISAIALIPGAEMLRFTARTQLDYATASLYSLPWASLAGLFSPLVFGRGVQNFWGPWDRVELGYVGVLPLVFAGFASFKNRRGISIFLVILGSLAWLIALGANTPLHYFLYQNVPGFAQLRAPARFILLTDFSIAVLAGLGLQRLNTMPRKQILLWCSFLLIAGFTAIYLNYHQAVASTGFAHNASLYTGLIITFSLLLIGLFFCLWLPSREAIARRPSSVLRLTQWSFVLFLSADLLGHGAWIEVDSQDATLGFQHPKALEFLQSQPLPTRIDNASGAWSPDAAARYGLEDINGLSNPLALAAYQTYLGAVGARGTPLYNFLNAQFVIADKDRPPADSTFVPIFNEDPALDIYLNTNAMPRVSLVYSATLVPNGEAAFGAIHDPSFNPLVSVVAEGMAPTPTLPPSESSPMGEGSQANLYYLDYAAESFTVVAITPAPAYLVFSEVWYPGWRAWVDGVETPIFIANFAFRGIYLTQAGEHTIVMRFDPLSWKIGLGITLLTVLGLIVWIVVHVRALRQAPGTARVSPELVAG
jgi:hypothetical protein